MILIIDSSGNDNFVIALTSSKGELVAEKLVQGQFINAEKILPAIEQVMSENKIKTSDLSGIGVVAGPGGFTSLRIGIIIANALSYALKIPIIGFKKDQFNGLPDLAKKCAKKITKSKIHSVAPFYGREPNITKPKIK
ncbi:tRNA (adenosine(37)-N6)-threonylcarbamoyltransferase complex dimerization subunit type 1 TsaB [Patescibacteria group bacterium]|nr:tRNA (adenosine(37)-N6)-threonylcarbamoyltransferase complex dimerization subunit type 1 TsaB [Patescibacteria group bacterium]MBU0963758.1 tRNA (adenosine(37)-N6)-threonylcarbamoyltransferase complex dimerization subunit type 1 TsaB [Patescibacteria group bacterium]